MGFPEESKGMKMGTTYHIDKKLGITFAVWDGSVTEDELMVHLRQLTADPDWPGKNCMQLSDLQATSLSTYLDETKLKKVVAFLNKFRGRFTNMKMARVAHEAYQMSNIFQHLMMIYPVSVIAFNGLSTACTWLGVDSRVAEHPLQQLRSRLREGTSQE